MDSLQLCRRTKSRQKQTNYLDMERLLDPESALEMRAIYYLRSHKHELLRKNYSHHTCGKYLDALRLYITHRYEARAQMTSGRFRIFMGLDPTLRHMINLNNKRYLDSYLLF